jgi:hypothetical protein
MLESAVKLKEKFRVLCLTESFDNIQMWGYYGDGGNGVCCKYDIYRLIQSLEAFDRQFICVYGKVEYKKNKPTYKYSGSNLNDDLLSYVINNMFTKSKGWEHEKEIRFVLFNQNLNEKVISFESDVSEHILGCNLKNESLEFINNWKNKANNSISKL